MSNYDFSSVYSSLKDFQMATVDYVFQRMYEDTDPAKRFLVADEVGLGKTLVARGVIARAIERLDREGIDRIDVVYICSNSDIARQNINRLNVTGNRDFAFASRITLLAAQLQDLTKNKLNFVSFTPGTSFDLKSNMGTQDERKLLYWLLKEAWGPIVGTKKGPKRALQGGVTDFEIWEERLGHYRSKARNVDPGLRQRFFDALHDADEATRSDGQPGYRDRFQQLSIEWAHDRVNPSWEERHRRALFIGELRNLLARTTIDALEPDLIILDEFQRFKHLLDGETDAAQLAHSMFNYSDDNAEARVLLLSATPYKMYTLTDESADDDHYEDFLRTVEFLKDGEAGELKAGLSDLRRELVNLGAGDHGALLSAKSRVETELRQVMARTERLAVTEDRQGMLVQATKRAPDVTVGDLVASVHLQRASDILEAGGMVEYWKSVPYFANFWGDYKIGREHRRAEREDPQAARNVRNLLAAGRELLPWRDYESWKQIDPGNARLRTLISQTLDSGDWKRLWMAPSLPYYELGPPFDESEARTATKRLVFSAWNAVPRAVSSLLSYEAERRMVAAKPGGRRPNTPEGREKFTEPLRFPKTATGMTAFAVVYPSASLAMYGDPLELSRQLGGEEILSAAEDVLAAAERELMRRLAPHLPTEGPVDERWYWAAPLVLDREVFGQGGWLQGREVHQAWTGPEAKRSAGFELHVELARAVDRGETELGRPPDDLGRVLALLAVGGPGNIALRSFSRITQEGDADYCDMALLDEAAQVAWAFRSLLNTPETTTLIQGLTWGDGNPYWRKALHYAVNGCLQAVMDEYVHVLREWLGILDTDNPEALTDMASNVADVVSLRAADLRARDPQAPLDAGEKHMRSRFALPFAKHKSEEEKDTRRAGFVRAAFNSPFWPNVLTTTSVGQEGLDFHLYCHAVVHWNLPANPVDLEQREGRVHRYMGHAVRKNLAATHRDAALTNGARSPWDVVLEAAIAKRDPGLSDIVPFWIYLGDAQIERHVLALPLSREISRLEDLQRSLAVYRLVFGQPRQEELAAWLTQLGADKQRELLDVLRVDLSPRAESAVSTHTAGSRAL